MSFGPVAEHDKKPVFTKQPNTHMGKEIVSHEP